MDSLVLWTLFLGFSWTATSFLAGIYEGAVLGPYSAQAVWAPFFEIYAVTSSGDWGQVPSLIASNFGGITNSLMRMAFWNYEMYNSGIGMYIRVVLIVFSAAFLLFLTISILRGIASAIGTATGLLH